MKYLVKADDKMDVIDGYYDAIELGDKWMWEGSKEYTVYRLVEMAHQNKNGFTKNKPSWEE